MRNWPWPPLAVLLVIAAYLGWRVEQLDARVEALSKGPHAVGEDAEEGEDTREELVDRLRSAEAEVATVKNELDNLSHRVDPALEEMEEGGDPAHILDVVEQENARIRERHLAFHSGRWMENREAALARFADIHELTPGQVQHIQRHLQGEVDHIVELLSSKEAIEDPEQAVSDWHALLAETDRVVLETLEGEAVKAWADARAFERAVFMPWLQKVEP